jgi:hypothetical protein
MTTKQYGRTLADVSMAELMKKPFPPALAAKLKVQTDKLTAEHLAKKATSAKK